MLERWLALDKTTWGPGPWQAEPDEVLWCDLATRLPCLAMRATLGHWCGYVGVPPGHAGYGADPAHAGVVQALDVHGGLNYGAACEASPCCAVVHPAAPAQHPWWLGFDCGHLRDLSPGMRPLLVELARADPRLAALFRRRQISCPQTYCPLAYVQTVCAHLAAQLATLEVIDVS